MRLKITRPDGKQTTEAAVKRAAMDWDSYVRNKLTPRSRMRGTQTAVRGMTDRLRQAAAQSKDAALVKFMQDKGFQQLREHGQVDDMYKPFLAMHGTPGSKSWNRAGRFFTDNDWFDLRKKIFKRHPEMNWTDPANRQAAQNLLAYYGQADMDQGTSAMLTSMAANVGARSFEGNAGTKNAPVIPGKEWAKMLDETQWRAGKMTSLNRQAGQAEAPRWNNVWDAVKDWMSGRKIDGEEMGFGDVLDTAFT